VCRGLQLHREEKFDAIMAYGTNTPGIAGVILKWITNVPLISEIPGVPENAFRYDEPHPGNRTAIKRFLADQLVGLVCTTADCIKLLYPWQLRRYPRLHDKKIVVFQDFVPVHLISPEQSEENFILLAGFPWYTKGVDVLIRAFKLIVAQFPDYKLKLMGYYPDRKFLNSLAADCPQIEFLIIASAVGGVPYYIKDNDNGLLFQSENVEELAAKLATLLSNPELQVRLAKRAHEKAFSEYDEQSYVRSFHSMLQSLRDELPGSHRSNDQFEETTATSKSTGL
jgi:glycosyltransferase involved in cell wall biosynthesis